MNHLLAMRALQTLIDQGGREVCVCPGSRNSPLVTLLTTQNVLKVTYGYEERSSAFFALGRAQETGLPVAIVTTSGTAAAELLPAMIEAFYTGTPLLAITADRPRHFRGSGAPQSCEQVGLFSHYVKFAQDAAEDEPLRLDQWKLDGPAQLNLCFAEPLNTTYRGDELAPSLNECVKPASKTDCSRLNQFLDQVRNPLVIVSALKESAKEVVKKFLSHLGAPIYLEGLSGLREDSTLAPLQVHRSSRVWESAASAGYPIDGVLRIGGVPTLRLWRDLEEPHLSQMSVLSISDQPFSGVSNGKLIHAPLDRFFEEVDFPNKTFEHSCKWRVNEALFWERLHALFLEERDAEPSLIHFLSKIIRSGTKVYVGNSLPIREWDLGAVKEDKNLRLRANRGVNGIDGQLSTWLGHCSEGEHHVGLFGDLTSLYDLAAPWFMKQIQPLSASCIIINNGGGQIFSRMYKEKEFLNQHTISFEGFAALWGMSYHQWKEIPAFLPDSGFCVIELLPDADATARFWEKLQLL